jgi:hypothetical protein
VAWLKVTAGLVNRWLAAARSADADLEIEHLLAARRRRPGIYTDWKRDGYVIYPAFVDQLRRRVYSAEGYEFTPLSTFPEGYEVERRDRSYVQPGIILPGDQVLADSRAVAAKAPRKRGISNHDDVGLMVAELHSSFGYSTREIRAVWARVGSKRPEVDRSPRVTELVRRLRSIAEHSPSHSTIARMLGIYSFRASPRAAEVGFGTGFGAGRQQRE